MTRGPHRHYSISMEDLGHRLGLAGGLLRAWVENDSDTLHVLVDDPRAARVAPGGTVPCEPLPLAHGYMVRGVLDALGDLAPEAQFLRRGDRAFYHFDDVCSIDAHRLVAWIADRGSISSSPVHQRVFELGPSLPLTDLSGTVATVRALVAAHGPGRLCVAFWEDRFLAAAIIPTIVTGSGA